MLADESLLQTLTTPSPLNNDSTFYPHPIVCGTNDTTGICGINEFAGEDGFSRHLFNPYPWFQTQSPFYQEWSETKPKSSTIFTYVSPTKDINSIMYQGQVQTTGYSSGTHIPTIFNDQQQVQLMTGTSLSVNACFTGTLNMQIGEELREQIEPVTINVQSPQNSSPTIQSGAVSSKGNDNEDNDCSSPKSPSWGDLEHFVQEFKKRRNKLGYTQEKVGFALGNLYGNVFSQTYICRFESLQLSMNNMRKLKPLLSKWLDEAESNCLTSKATDHGTNVKQRTRKMRTPITYSIKSILENHFVRIQNPRQGEICRISKEVQLEKEVVRAWFSNRRQKERKISISGAAPISYFVDQAANSARL